MGKKPTSKPPLDWRYRTVTTLAKDWKSPYTGFLHKVGTPVSVTTFVKHASREIQIGDPSAPALFLSISWQSYQDALKRNPFRPSAKPQKGKDPSRGAYDYLEAIMSSILFAYTAIEAFANEEIPADYSHPSQRRSGLLVVLWKPSIERQVDLSEKLATILPDVMKVASPKGTKTWQDYIELKRMRDRLVHMKSSDRAVSKHGNLHPDSIWRALLAPSQPNYPLAARNMVAVFAEPEKTHWLKYCPVS
jgi:hypothetical protein